MRPAKTVPQVALNWLLRRPTVCSIIIGARNEEQLLQNIGAVGWSLTTQQVAALDVASEVPAAYPVWQPARLSDVVRTKPFQLVGVRA